MRCLRQALHGSWVVAFVIVDRVSRSAGVLHDTIGNCPVQTPAHSWSAAAVHRSAAIRVSDISVLGTEACDPRTLHLDGFCNDENFASKNYAFQGASGYDWEAHVTTPIDVTLRSGSAQCMLTSIAVQSLGIHGAYQGGMSMRFQFERCTMGSSRVGLVVGLRPDPNGDSNLVNWMCKISGRSCTPMRAVPTEHPPTTPAPGLIDLRMKVWEQNVGQGVCTGRRFLQQLALHDVQTAADCRLKCVRSITDVVNSNNPNDPTRCQGFAFSTTANSDGVQCILYTMSEILDSDTTNPGLWNCYNLTVRQGGMQHASAAGSIQDVTTAPPIPQHEGLQLSQYFAGALSNIKTSLMQRIQPPTDHPTCFDALDWYTLEDDKGNLASIPFRPNQWFDLVNMLPDKRASTASIPSPGAILVQRTYVTMCGGNDTMPSCIPTVPRPQPETTGLKSCIERVDQRALIAGVCAPLVTLALLWVLESRRKRQNARIKFLIENQEQALATRENMRPGSRSPQQRRSSFWQESHTSQDQPGQPGSPTIVKPMNVALICLVAFVTTLLAATLLDAALVELLPLIGLQEKDQTSCEPARFSTAWLEQWALCCLAPSLALVWILGFAVCSYSVDSKNQPKRHRVVLAHVEEDASGNPMGHVHAGDPVFFRTMH